MEENKKLFYFVLKQYHHRQGTVIGKTVGILYADNVEEAEQIVRKKHISEFSTLEFVEEVNGEFCYTVYRSAM